ncbi:thiol-specific monooxygenase [Pleomassaria siparia CBS 279.74]|uniref:Thiol-specific monooxygenase n=1 Tax=Pleomassaria siparia CBS 279.74 TaxID=1314801 RepID=A0A6G1KH46_9PLEO|nr:thiol-specific monooxygenase [Pleomassaria siparia CBS 279.74]
MNIKSVAVIGAGPAGLAAAKYLDAEKAFAKIVVYDQRPEPGGVWNYTSSPPNPNHLDVTVPRTRPSDLPERCVSNKLEDGTTEAYFPSPIYDLLETNIPHILMNFSDRPFPKDCPLFPEFRIVKRYLDEYAIEIRHLLKLATQVQSISLVKEKGVARWKVVTENVQSKEREEEEVYDAVVCATGHYSDPYIPNIKGVSDFHERYPSVISHSKYYRRPEPYADKKVLIVGNSASGLDISKQISTVTPHVLISEKEKPNVLHNVSSNIAYHSEISEFLPRDKGVRFTNGHVETDIDCIVFCTGYQYSFPFLQGLDPHVTTTGERTQGTYEHVFYYPEPTLAFLTLPQRIVPFPVAEAQSVWVARIFSGRLTLPEKDSMRAWEEATITEKGSGKSFHNLAYPRDAEYINRLFEHSMSAVTDRRLGLENDGRGKIPPYWGEEKRWTRERFPMIKKAAQALGERRFEIRSLPDLGFDFEAWKREQTVKE